MLEICQKFSISDIIQRAPNFKSLPQLFYSDLYILALNNLWFHRISKQPMGNKQKNMIVKQSNKSCKQEKDTEPKLPALSAESCFLRVD